MSASAIDVVRAVESEHRKLEQVSFVTEHTIHGGIYLRTVRIPKDAIITGVLVKVATNLIVVGDAIVFTGYETVRVTGYATLPASAGRKQIFRAISELILTMSFPCDVKTVAEAEALFTDEVSLLPSLADVDRHRIIITGE